MEPKFAMSVQTAGLTLALVLFASNGAAYEAFLISAVVSVLALAAEAAYLAKAWTTRPVHRRRLDWVVRAQLLTVLLAGTATWLVIGDDEQLLGKAGPAWDALIFGGVVATTAILVSSLIDWYWVLPQVGGLTRPAPCQAPGSGRWSAVTSQWLAHRSLATIAASFSIAAVPAYLLELADSGDDKALWVVVLTFTLGVLGVYNRAAGAALRASFNPPTHVGDFLAVESFAANEVAPSWSAAMMIDASVQGSKFKALDAQRQFVGTAFHEKSDGPPIANEELAKCHKVTAAPPCPPGVCSGINWYCRNNPDAYGRRA